MILRADKMGNEEKGNKRTVGTRNVGLRLVVVYAISTHISRSYYLRPPCKPKR
jgi:hypothetical protein